MMPVLVSSMLIIQICVCSPIRLAIYNGNGTGGAKSTITVLRNVVSKGLLDANITLADGDIIDTKLNNEDFDVVWFPGGSGHAEEKGITDIGIQKVRDFVRNGGGYIGVCAGGYLSTYNFTWSLKILSSGVKEPWDRGMGNVTIQFSDKGLKTLNLTGYQGLVPIYYGQGPILRPMQLPDLPSYTPLAVYKSEIHSKHTNVTTGQMVNTDAIVVSKYGKGRVLVSSPHPELSKPPIYDFVSAYVKYVTNQL